MPELVHETSIGSTVKIKYQEVDDLTVRIKEWWSKPPGADRFRRRKDEEGHVVARTQIPGLGVDAK